MRSRAAILPFPGDPFLLNYWLNLFDNIWGNEVDALYIGFNSSIEQPVVDYIKARVNQSIQKGHKIVIDYQDHMADHGPTIDRLLEICDEDLVMLVEDDGFIFKPGIVDYAFKQLESGQFDIVASKRGSCHMDILLAAQAKWGLSYEGDGDHGPNFWPNYFFSSKKLLLETDRNFAAKSWKKGDVVQGLDLTVESELIHGDTFVNTSLQLRGKVPMERILCLPQYHGHPDDLQHAEQGRYLFDGKAPWTHIGSLSSGVGGILRDANNRPLARRLIDKPEEKTELNKSWCQTDFEKREFERRVQWWLTFYETIKAVPNSIAEFYDLYGKAIQQIIEQYGLDIHQIHRRQKVYKILLGL